MTPERAEELWREWLGHPIPPEDEGQSVQEAVRTTFVKALAVGERAGAMAAYRDAAARSGERSRQYFALAAGDRDKDEEDHAYGNDRAASACGAVRDILNQSADELEQGEGQASKLRALDEHETATEKAMFGMTKGKKPWTVP